jgi:hypothetical protein
VIGRVLLPTLVGTVFFALAAASLVAADSTQPLEVTVSAEAVAITISGNVNFGGPYPANAFVRAHLQTSTQHAIPPSVTNSGNVGITFLSLSYEGPTGQEALCGGGGTWAAHQSTTGPNQFVIKAWASTTTALTTFNSSSTAVHPTSGTGNILSATNSPVAPAASIPLQFILQMPNPALTGGAGCSITLSVTAAAAS